jgi:transcriptional regulator
MYVPRHFGEQRVEVLHQLIRERPLGTWVTLSGAGLNADHLPFEVDTEPAPFGTLRGHVARGNPAAPSVPTPRFARCFSSPWNTR